MLIHVTTTQKRQIINITDTVADQLGSKTGLVNLLAQHTTCALTLADLDPGTDQDYLKALAQLTPRAQWQHPHDPSHFPDHFWSSVIGPSLTVPVKDAQLQLGTWQQIILIELDGPRERSIELTLFSLPIS